MNLQVTVEITAVEFRRLNSFEWVVLTILNTFQGDAPSIAEVASQLSIGEPAFLSSALETLCSVQGVQRRTNELHRLDLNDYELSETGKTILREDGWEASDEEFKTESITLDWPSLRFVSHQNRGRGGERKQDPPYPDEVQLKLTTEILEAWLNQNNAPCQRVKHFYVVNVEMGG